MELLNRMGMGSNTNNRTLAGVNSPIVDPYKYTSIPAYQSLPEALRQTLSQDPTKIRRLPEVPQAFGSIPQAAGPSSVTSPIRPLPQPPAQQPKAYSSHAQDETLVGQDEDAYVQRRSSQDQAVSTMRSARAASVTEFEPYPRRNGWTNSPGDTTLAQTGMAIQADPGHNVRPIEPLDNFLNKSFAPQPIYTLPNDWEKPREQLNAGGRKPKSSFWSCCRPDESSVDGYH